jgi:hypothetical protein
MDSMTEASINADATAPENERRGWSLGEDFVNAAQDLSGLTTDRGAQADHLRLVTSCRTREGVRRYVRSEHEGVVAGGGQKTMDHSQGHDV